MSILQAADEPEVSVPLDRLRWTWRPEEAPVRVQIPLDLVSRLRGEIASNGRASVAEVGGVLTGRSGSTPGSIEIHGYAWVPYDGESGGQYRLDAAALRPLREIPENQGELPIVGYFRTQLEGALHLRKAEVDIVTDQFHDGSNVVLLIRPSSDDFKAGFLFWEGDTFVPFSIQDFTFDAESLRGAATVLPSAIPAKALMEADAPAVIVPVTEPVSVPPGERAMLQPDKPLFYQGGHPRSYFRPALLGLSAAVVACAVVAFMLQDRLLPAPRFTSAPIVTASVPIELHAEVEGGGLDIRWNPKSTPVINAREGHLALVQSDGREEIVPLDLLQLGSGQMKLSSWGDSAAVRLEVLDGSGRVTRESFSALRPVPELEIPAVPATPVPAGKWSPALRSTNQEAVTPDKTTPAKWKPSSWKPTPLHIAPPPAVAADPAESAASFEQSFAGKWTYSTDRGRYDGAEPEVVDGVIHEENGHLSGTMFVHFKRRPDGNPDVTHKFEFAGDLHRGRTQVFPLNSVAGTAGTIELIAGNSPNVLEVRFQTPAGDGAIHSGNMILVKK